MSEQELPFNGSHAPTCPYHHHGECLCWRSDPEQNPDLAADMDDEDDDEDGEGQEKTYDVHLYAVVRVKVSGVKAQSPEEAAKKADKSIDLHTAFPAKEYLPGVTGEYAEEVEAILVDTLDASGKVVKETTLDGNYVPK